MNALEDGSQKHRTNNGRPPDSTIENLEGDDEKVDKLVTMVLGLETKVSSKTAYMETLKSKNQELENQVKSLEEEKKSLEGDSKTLTSESNDSDVDISKSAGSNEKSTYEKSYKILEELLYNKKRLPSTVEEKFCRDINQLVEENLQSLLRFSTSSQKIHKFPPKVEELHNDFLRVRKNTKKPRRISHLHQVRIAMTLKREIKHIRRKNLEKETQHTLGKEIQHILEKAIQCIQREKREIQHIQQNNLEREIHSIQRKNNKVIPIYAYGSVDLLRSFFKFYFQYNSSTVASIGSL
ncbi:hypothetical protein ACLOJK_038815 [Asimina triloba]